MATGDSVLCGSLSGAQEREADSARARGSEEEATSMGTAP